LAIASKSLPLFALGYVSEFTTRNSLDCEVAEPRESNDLKSCLRQVCGRRNRVAGVGV